VLGSTTLVSVDSNGIQGDGLSRGPSISADGRFVAFQSFATNLAPNHVGTTTDTFIHDRVTGVTQLLSVSSSGVQANSPSYSTALSSDGRFAAFSSSADNLTPAHDNLASDVFVRDLLLGSNSLATASTFGGLGNGNSYTPSLSGDGRFVVFSSDADNLVAGDTNNRYDVFVRDLLVCDADLTRYCTAKTNSAGCVPSIVWRGRPSVSGQTSFLIGAEQVLGSEAAILFYGVQGSNAAAFQDGTLCVQSPLHRTAPRLSANSGAPPCTGVCMFDFGAHLVSGSDLTLNLGAEVWAQFWMRDPNAASGTGLSDAVHFVICQ